jgi:hypothetical protein
VAGRRDPLVLFGDVSLGLSTEALRYRERRFFDFAGTSDEASDRFRPIGSYRFWPLCHFLQVVAGRTWRQLRDCGLPANLEIERQMVIQTSVISRRSRSSDSTSTTAINRRAPTAW